MSYFMTVAGSLPSLHLSDSGSVRFIPISEAQPYLQALAPDIAKADGVPLFLVEDGETGTSHEIVVDAEDRLGRGETLNGTVMFTLMQAFADRGNTFRVWWAANKPDAYNSGVVCTSLSDVVSTLQNQASRGQDLQVRACFLKG
jgi:hypothetical protein